MMKKRIFVAMMAAAMAMTSLAGCGSGAGKSTGGNAEAKVEAPTEPFGDTIKYDPSVEINDGKDISVEQVIAKLAKLVRNSEPKQG